MRAYGEDCFKFTDNFIRITFPTSAHDTDHDKNEISKFIRILVSNMEGDLQSKIGIKHRQHFRNAYLKPSLDEGYIEFTLPNEKQSKLQKYRLTAKGMALKKSLKNSK